jgi:peptidoglycan hydrolase-like protein with peptidoglycan-binding domain
LLNEKGFDAGPVDGIFGNKTENALREFEESKGLPADGVLDSTSYTYLTQASDLGAAMKNLRSSVKQFSGERPSTKTTGQGAALGATIGGLAGYASGGGTKSAIVGALVGAIIGNYIEHQQVRSSQQVYRKHGREERVVLNDVQLSQDIVQPGQEGQATVNYDVVAPDPDTIQSITHTMTYYHGDAKLATNTQTIEIAPGGYKTVFPLAVPEGAEEGQYRLVAQIQSPNAKDLKERSFQVIYARDEHGVLRIAGITLD